MDDHVLMFKGLLWGLPISLALWAMIGFGAITLRDMIGDARYWPPACQNNICVLTGLGGIVSVWERHIDDNQGALFIVRGTCASACEIAYRRALAQGRNVIVEPGAKLVVHKPEPITLK